MKFFNQKIEQISKIEHIEFQKMSILAKDDLNKILNGKVILSAIAPLESEEQIAVYSKKFYIDPEWVYKRVHLYFIFLNPLTKEIDVTTSYNSPTQPPYLLFRGPNDPVGLFQEEHEKSENFHNPVHSRDIMAVINPEKRLSHKTISMEVNDADPMKLALALKHYRLITAKGIINSDLPLYGAKGLCDRNDTKNLDCQLGTLMIWQHAYPEKALFLPTGSELTWLNENNSNFIINSNEIKTTEINQNKPKKNYIEFFINQLDANTKNQNNNTNLGTTLINIFEDKNDIIKFNYL